jgi:xylose dehydrogenase (NAD/NADP)
MTDKLRWGLLSTARINSALIDPIRRANRSELTAIASRSLASAQSYAEQWGIPRSFGSYEEMLADPEIDAVYISLPNGLHCEWTLKAAQTGKHVLCEKPLVVSIEEMNQVEAAARQNGVTIFEAFMYLHHPQTLMVKEMIQGGRIGQLVTIESSFNFNLPPSQATNVRLQPSLTGGSLWDVGVYPNSMAIVMSGGQAPVEIWAHQLTGESGVDVGMRAQLRFANDVIAQISSGFRTPFRQGATFIGDQGIIHVADPWKPGVDGQPSQVTIADLKGASETISTPGINPYGCEVAAMEACVLDGAAPVLPLSLSREFLRSVLAMYRSAETGGIVRP